MAVKTPNGHLYEQAAQFAHALEDAQTAAAQEMLAAWSESYWAIRQDMDHLLAKMAQAKAAGIPTSPAWFSQQVRLKTLLNTTKTEMAKYAHAAADVTNAQTKAALAAAVKHAGKMAGQAVAENLPGLVVDLAHINPAVLEAAVGFLADGSPLRAHLAATLPAEAAENVRHALVRGAVTGKGEAWLVREATKALGMTHSRAVTIMRTESLRSYRAASRATYLANSHVVGSWTWHAALDARTCVCCVAMHGTHHGLDETLDGHPRCRCAMVPRTKSWSEVTGQDLPDTRPTIPLGSDWLDAQPPAVQRALMGPRKFDAWKSGQITLDDMVARHYDPTWGTMRSERSMKAIAEGVHANWTDPIVPKPPTFRPPPKPQPKAVKALVNQYDVDALKAAAQDLEGQALANHQAAILWHLERGEMLGPNLPGPDPVKVDKALAKLEAAAETKGYPSKGFSQTLAVYKAHATGKVGSPVGPIKALSWEQKTNAEAILSAWETKAQGILRAQAKAAKVEAAHDQALADWKHLVDDTAPDAFHQAQADLVDKALADYVAAYSEGVPSTAQEAAKAYANTIAAQAQAYQDALAITKAKAGTTWKAVDGSTGTITEDGWLGIHHDGTYVTWDPIQTQDALTSGHWEQIIEPEPDKVKAVIAGLTDADGTLSANVVKALEEALADPPPMWTAQHGVNVQEALAQAKATLPWKPDPVKVQAMLDHLESGAMTPEGLTDLVALGNDPQVKASLDKALQDWADLQALKAVTEAPIPAPAIDVDKIAWDKVSDAQVGKVMAKVQSGEWSMGDLYAAFQKSKNSGPKANYAKAILTLDSKADTIPALVDKNLLEQWTKDLDAGTITVQDLEDLAAWSGATALDKATAQAVLKAHGKGPAPTAAAAPAAPAPPPPMPDAPPFVTEDLKFTGTTLGTHGAQVWEAPDGTRWLFKPPKNPQDQFLVSLDAAGSRLQARAGLRAPDTYVVTLNGRRGSIQRMFQSEAGFPHGFRPETLSAGDMAAVQKEHVLDWLLSNHDGHVDQFLRLPTGELVGIDKGQAFRWFGQDRLDWNFHPNQAYGAPPPVYNRLWADFADGKDVDLMGPQHGGYADAIKSIQAIGDVELREMFREYAEQAAARGLLAKRQNYPGLVPPKVKANDVEAFLDALVQRKHDLQNDFQDLWDRAVAARQKALPDWKPTKPTGLKGGPKPEPPTAPEAPAAQVAADFDPWLERVKDKYQAFSGKSLESSNNWGRVRRVIDQRDRAAVQELLDRHYLDQDLADEARRLIDQAEAKVKALEAAHAKAMADHAALMERYKRDVKAWKEANGITEDTVGMDDGVVRHDDDQAGITWAQRHFQESRYTAGQRTTLRSYTGSAYDSWNTHLRTTEGKPTQYHDAYAKIDKAMEAQPIPEDVILHRGVGDNYSMPPFALEGKRFGSSDDLTQIIGSVQVDWGYMSTSVGNSAAFSGKPIQLKIRAPQGTPGAYVQMFSQFQHERELILARGTHLYVHNAYKQNGRWFLEVEVVPDGFDPTFGAPTPSARPWSN